VPGEVGYVALHAYRQRVGGAIYDVKVAGVPFGEMDVEVYEPSTAEIGCAPLNIEITIRCTTRKARENP
jgi:hypothetical protein